MNMRRVFGIDILIFSLSLLCLASVQIDAQGDVAEEPEPLANEGTVCQSSAQCSLGDPENDVVAVPETCCEIEEGTEDGFGSCIAKKYAIKCAP